MLEFEPKLFEDKDNPGLGAESAQQFLKTGVIYPTGFSVICTAEDRSILRHSRCTPSCGVRYGAQLTDRTDSAIETGLGNWTETAECGSPAYVGGQVVYGQGLRAPFWSRRTGDCLSDNA